MNFKKHLHQTITHWIKGSPDGFGGYHWTRETTKARWEQRTQLYVDSNGDEQRSAAVVYLGKDVKIGDWVYLGVSSSTSPTGVTGSLQIKDFRKIPDLYATDYERKIYL